MDERLSRHDLTDEQWALLAPLMPPHPRQGHRWTDHRLVIDGVFHRTRTGTPWRDLPARFGPWQTVYNRHRRWSADGTWERILAALQTGSDVPDGRSGGQVWTVAVDSTIVRAHQHAAGALKKTVAMPHRLWAALGVASPPKSTRAAATNAPASR